MQTMNDTHFKRCSDYPNSMDLVEFIKPTLCLYTKGTLIVLFKN